MKKDRLMLVLCMLLTNFVGAQQLNHCKTPDKINELKNSDARIETAKLISEQKIQNWIAGNKNNSVDSILVVPVVVHVLYKNTTQNIPDSQIQLQLAILNKDYRKENSDTTATPAAFKTFAADCKIEFCLANRDPSGNRTTGITRKMVAVSEIGNSSSYYNSALGGEDIWDRNFYLNIWVCEIDLAGGTLGYSTVPSFNPPASSDGVVIDYRYFGTSTNTHYDLGRTATHEIGHWFDLQHIWGDDFGLCSTDDFVGDTPLQTSEHYGLPAFPNFDSCSSVFPGTMFMNYMDYTDDNGMNLFTEGQKLRMRAAIATTFRDSLFKSKGCVPGDAPIIMADELFISPNPTTASILITLNLVETSNVELFIYNILGELILEDKIIETQKYAQNIDLSSYSNGVYLLKINTGTAKWNRKIIKI